MDTTAASPSLPAPTADTALRLRVMSAMNAELIARIEKHSAQLAALATLQGIPLDYFAGVFEMNQARIDLLKSLTPPEDQMAA